MPKTKIKKAGAFVDLGASAGVYLDKGDVPVAVTLDPTADFQRVRLTGNAAITLPAGLTTNVLKRLLLVLEQDGTGGRVPTIGGTAPSTVIATEDFSEANGTAMVGKTTATGGKVWSGTAGWTVQSGRMRQSGAPTIGLNVGSANQKISGKKMVYSAGNTGFALRMAGDRSSFLWVQITSSAVTIYDAPDYSQVAPAFNQANSAGDLFEAEIDANNLFTVKKNGVVIISVTTAAHAGQTYVGFAPNSAGTDEWDDVIISQGGAAIAVIDPLGLGVAPNPAANSKTILELVSGDGGATYFVETVSRSGRYASLDGTGKVPSAQLPSITAAMAAADMATQAELDAAVAGVGEAFYNGGNIGSSEAINLGNGKAQRWTLDANTTIALPAGLSAAQAQRVILDLVQDGTGGRTVTFGGAAPGASAPTLRGTASAISGGNLSWSVNKPAGVIAGDLLIAIVETGNTGSTAAPPAGQGWTLVTTVNGTANSARIWKKVAGASEPASYLFTQGAGNGVTAVIVALAGAADVEAYGGTGDTLTAPTITTLSNNALLMHVITHADSAGDITPPSGYTEIIDVDNASYDNVEVSTKTQAVAGASGTAAGGGTGTSGSSAIHLAISPGGPIVYRGYVSVDTTPTSHTVIEAVSFDGGSSWFLSQIGNDLATQAELDAVVSALSVIGSNNQTGTTYTLILSDAGKVVELNNATGTTVTVPLNASVAFPIGTVIELWQQGAGQITVAPEAGVTIRSTEGKLKSYGQYSSLSLRKRALAEWVLTGDLVA